jgi:CheY-like chemotaxis protein
MSRTSKLVVVIDDDPLVLEATKGLLRSWGCEVVAAESCGEAIKMLSVIGRRPDFIICDYRLPEGSTGADAIEILRNAFQIPALLISADEGSLHTEAERNSCYALRKPVNAAAFRAALIDAAVL